jgi:hypothetical protein
MTSFHSLTIERATWGVDKGKLQAKLTLVADKGTTTLTLPDSVGLSILQLAKTSIIDAVEKSANDFIFDLTTSIPDQLNLTNQ